MGLQRVRHDWASELNWTEDVFIEAQLIYNIILVLGIQDSDRDADAENRQVGRVGETKGGMRVALIDTH